MRWSCCCCCCCCCCCLLLLFCCCSCCCLLFLFWILIWMLLRLFVLFEHIRKNTSHQSDKKSVRPSKRLCRISSQKERLIVKVGNIQVTKSLRHHLSPRIPPKPTLSWAHLGYVLSTGSRDHHILHRDVRQPAPYMRTSERIWWICGWHMFCFRIGKVSHIMLHVYIHVLF